MVYTNRQKKSFKSHNQYNNDINFFIFTIFFEKLLIFNFLNKMLYIFSYEYMSIKIHQYVDII